VTGVPSVNRASIPGAVAGYVFALVLLLPAVGIGVVSARTGTPAQTHVVPTTQARAAGAAQFDLIIWRANRRRHLARTRRLGLYHSAK
jgi:hypothetical protein